MKIGDFVQVEGIRALFVIREIREVHIGSGPESVAYLTTPDDPSSFVPVLVSRLRPAGVVEVLLSIRNQVKPLPKKSVFRTRPLFLL